MLKEYRPEVITKLKTPPGRLILLETMISRVDLAMERDPAKSHEQGPSMLKRQVGIIALFVVAVAGLHAAQPAPSGFVTRSGSRLMLGGREYRAIGVNHPDLFGNYIGTIIRQTTAHGTPEQDRQNAITSVLEAERNGIAFIRFWATGVWPVDQKLYFDNPAVYWARMDELFALCRTHHVRLVPSIFANGGLWADLSKEPKQAMLDPRSKTFQAMHKYAREIVSRYKNDSNILQWEIGNEYFLGADLPVAREAQDPKLVQAMGVKPQRVPEDAMTFEMLRQFYIEMVTFIKSNDRNHMVTSGDAGPRPESWELKVSYPQTRWRKDTLREYLADLLGSQPDPLDTMSIHYYGSLTFIDPDGSVAGLSSLEQLRCMVRAIHAANTPVFIGEFGNTKPTLAADKQSLHPLAALDLIEQENVSLTCIWAWYFPWQPDNDLRADTHPALLKRVQAYNKKFAGL